MRRSSAHLRLRLLRLSRLQSPRVEQVRDPNPLDVAVLLHRAKRPRILQDGTIAQAIIQTTGRGILRAHQQHHLEDTPKCHQNQSFSSIFKDFSKTFHFVSRLFHKDFHKDLSFLFEMNSASCTLSTSLTQRSASKISFSPKPSFRRSGSTS